MKQQIRNFVFRLIGKDPDGIVVTFLSGPAELARKMSDEVRMLIPDRRHFVVSLREPADVPGAVNVVVQPGSTWAIYRQLRARLGRFRIGMAPVLFTEDAAFRPLRRAAFLLAPGKVLAYNGRLERHHVRLSSFIASWLFLRGVPLDRIFLRPWWLAPWKSDKSVFPASHEVIDGRPMSPSRQRIAVLSPYFPYPLSHGGAVRIFNLLRELAKDFDIFLFAFSEKHRAADLDVVRELCAKIVLVPAARYREPRWSSLRPPEVCEYRSPAMRTLLTGLRREYGIQVVQVEYTYLASYPGDILVEHDVTFDLYRQIWERERTVSAWWNYFRWLIYEKRAVRRFRRVLTMSEKDNTVLGASNARTVANGVDLERFQPEPEQPGYRLLFIGSFRHFPNIRAYRFFTEEIWPLLRDRFPGMTLTVVAGPDPLLYWRQDAGSMEPQRDERIRLLEFVADVRPLYIQANVVIVPTTVSAGTNLKVLEAMAMQRAVVSTTSGCAGLGLEHGTSVWVADDAQTFAAGIATLASDEKMRARIARNARIVAERSFDWKSIGCRQREVIHELLPARFEIRPATEQDLPDIRRIQDAAPNASHWEPLRYLSYDTMVAVSAGRVAGFIVSRRTDERETEVLNLAIDPAFRRRGAATELLRKTFAKRPGEFFLEVRESNWDARKLYINMGFREAGVRPMYYDDPPEAAIVMRLHSC